MHRKIAILRGINVGGKRKLLMADLRSLCQDLGWKNVETYIQSGNVIFSSSEKNSRLEKDLEHAISEKFELDVPVIIRDAEEFRNLLERNPFYHKEAEISKLHLSFLKEVPSEENLRAIQQYNFEPDRFVVDQREVFIYCEGKYHQSKLSTNLFEKKLKTGVTTRNWKTVVKLVDLSNS
ncbi:DUF1697 domain-containing protein [Gramella sp. BOM4]|nr:DUF1697 domain-containing protein [Christiangramia bathymodioli]